MPYDFLSLNPLSTTKPTAVRKCGRFLFGIGPGLIPTVFAPPPFLPIYSFSEPILFVIKKTLLVMIVVRFIELICRRRTGPLFLLQNCK